MSNIATRGQLNPAKLINLSTKQEVNCMFNPFEYTITKSNAWSEKSVSGLNLPYSTFKHGGAQTLNLVLYFDTQVQNVNVRNYTSAIWQMTMIDKSRQNTFTRKAEPPPVAFSWGQLYFKAIITSLSEKFMLFNEQGIPVRSQVNISLKQYIDETELAPQMRDQIVMEMKNEQTAKPLKQGERLDHIASENGGSPSNYRNIAEANNIDNPLKQPTGRQIKR